MLTTLVILMTSQLGPGPLDAFQANYGSIRVDIEFVYKTGIIDPAALAEGRLWKPDLAIDEIQERRIVGEWGCDGFAEYYYFGSPDNIIENGKRLSRRRGERPSYVPKTEAVFDGEILAGRQTDRETAVLMDNAKTVNVWNNREPGFLSTGKAPFFWWISYPFPAILRVHFPEMTCQRRTALRDGHPTEVEIYEKEPKPGSRLRIEVSYDPAIGFLPRYARLLLVQAQGPALVKEFYAVEARPCAIGGFVPTEWYDTMFTVKDFATTYPEYDDKTILLPARGFQVGHFKTTSYKERPRSTPVALTHLQGVNSVASTGGRVRLKPGTKSLTLGDITSMMGRILTNPPALPLRSLDEKGKESPPTNIGPRTVDANEIGEYVNVSGGSRWRLLAAILLPVCVLMAVIVFRRRRAVLVLISMSCIPGCGAQEKVSVKVSATFKQPRVLYDLDARSISLEVAIRNDGNRELNILKIDGGCSCRKVDQTGLPTRLRPGRALSVKIEASGGRQSMPESIPLRFDTDHGQVETSATLLALPRNRINLDSQNHAALIESEEWTFELVHRAIRRSEEAKAQTTLIIPPEFVAAKVATHGGPVASATIFQYEDLTYRFTLKDRSLGLRKASVQLRDPDGRLLVEAPIVWRRVPFLSSVPERVTIGPRPVRVFLRCPDESVELTTVISSPIGIAAVVSSPREVTLRLIDSAPNVIDGSFEVGTTADGKPPLRVPVVRYAPIAQK